MCCSKIWNSRNYMSNSKYIQIKFCVSIHIRSKNIVYLLFFSIPNSNHYRKYPRTSAHVLMQHTTQLIKRTTSVVGTRCVGKYLKNIGNWKT